jgi:glycerol-3-phosphate dehydrogenase
MAQPTGDEGMFDVVVVGGGIVGLSLRLSSVTKSKRLLMNLIVASPRSIVRH